MGLAKCWVAGLLVAFAVNAQVLATTISYEVDNLGGSTWRYTYAVSNDTLATDIELFTVYFALGLYENLVVGATPPGWDPFVDDPDAGLLSDGIYDVLALVSGIAPGDTFGGFTVRFDFLGAGTPGAQPFDVFDAISFALVDSGTTTAAAATVSEPAALGLVLLVLAAAACRRGGGPTRRRRSANHHVAGDALQISTRATAGTTFTGGP